MKHGQHPWSEFLRQVRVYRGPEQSQDQDLEERLRGVVVVDDVSHVARPVEIPAGSAGHNGFLSAGNFAGFQIQAPQGGALIYRIELDGGSGGNTVRLTIRSAPSATAATAAVTVTPWGRIAPAAPVVRAAALAGAPTDGLVVPNVNQGRLIEQPIYVPSGMALEGFLTNATQLLAFGLLWQEFPTTLTNP